MAEISALSPEAQSGISFWMWPKPCHVFGSFLVFHRVSFPVKGDSEGSVESQTPYEGSISRSHPIF